MPRKLSAADKRAAKRLARAYALAIRQAERAFVRELSAIIRGVHASMLRVLEPIGRSITSDTGNAIVIRRDAGGREIDNVLRKVLPQIGPKVSSAHNKMSTAVQSTHRSQMSKIMPIGWQKLPNKTQEIALKARDESIKLVENAARVYADDVRAIFGDPERTFGRRWEDLRDELLARGDVSESRAELIARDQTLKLNGAINMERQTSAGLDQYIWNTSGDERVRDTHAEMDGEICDWNDPPLVGDENLHPGQDYQCRCVGVPYIPELADL